MKEKSNKWTNQKELLIKQEIGTSKKKDEFAKNKVASIFSISDEDPFKDEILLYDKSNIFERNINNTTNKSKINLNNTSKDQKTYSSINENENIFNVYAKHNEKITTKIFDENSHNDDEESISSGINNILFNKTTPVKNKIKSNNANESKSIQTDIKITSDNKVINYYNTIYSNSQNSNFDDLSKSSIVNYLIKDEAGIDEILDQVQVETKITKTSINKLKKAFKKKGLNNAKLIRLLRNKQQNWNFLLEEFKDVCTQITGVALYLENLLEQVKN